MKDAPLKRCPKCRGSVRRKIGAGAGLLFKGSGFYITDYRSDGYKKAADSDKSPPAPKPETKDKPKTKKPDA
jgi:predicted nucleic acid-binding Zn ribbon protein